jgi:hypothetical protein
VGRPKNDLNTPELKKVKETRAELVAAEDVAAAKRKEYDDAVVAALKENGYPTIAKVAEVTSKAIQNVAAKRGVTSPRA